MKNIISSLRGVPRRSNLGRFKFLARLLRQPIGGLAMTSGSSLLEVILAVALFLILSTGGLALVVNAYNANRLGLEFTVATQFASEGIEAAKAIKNQAYTNLINSGGTGVDRHASGYWVFGGANDTLVHNTGDSFIRTIKVESVNRNGTPPDGDIVASGGTLDDDTKKITSTVTWFFSGTRQETLSLITYLSDWRKALTTGIGEALLVYGDGTTTPKYRTYTSASGFTSGTDTVSGSSGQFFTIRTSPTKTEAIAGYINNSGNLQIMCFDGTVWTNEWSISVGGTGTTRRFDLAYETSSGDVMVVYSRNVASANGLAYRTKPGSSGCGSANWSAATNLATSPVATSSVVSWVKMARDSRSSSNNITAIWADNSATQGDLGVNNWSGTAWATGAGTFKALDTSLERITAPQDVDNFDIVYESVSGDIMVVWGTSAGANGTNGARYSTCTGGVYTCSWLAATAVPTVSDDIHNIDMTANPNTDQIIYAAIGDAGDDLTAAYWSGSAWTGYANLDASTESPIVGSRKVSTAWLINGGQTKWILNYDDATGTGYSWYYAPPGSAPIKPSDFSTTPAINDIRWRYEADMNPVNKNEAMVLVTDSTRAIFAKKVTMDATGSLGVSNWSDADGGASLGTTVAGPQQGFAFQYWRNP
jgi:hypothetical protein